ncbi:hypothetical protein [uncultured Porphyromonas sp.]|uniref:A1S_2505 family phage non-structural protein n=1 Tax=uncultured Porphyromonas sp. TaxID=159274 RepID=UPI00262940CF|nr:hypothetical protein [uncultured Porphyromonas sp.]
MTVLQTPNGWQRLADRTDEAYTPERISVLRENEIFVFGSNLLGHHMGGAARTARRVFNAEMGVAEGLTGQAYALPTLGEDMRRVAPEALRASLARLLRFALEHPKLTFYLTEVGCGIAGWPVETVRELLWEAVRELSEEAYEQRAVPANLLIPQRFS